MGMYDTVYYHCGACHSSIEVQSKAGECGLRKYKSNDVPVEIAASINGKAVECEECGAEWEVRALVSTMVPTMLVPHEPDLYNEYDYEIEEDF